MNSATIRRRRVGMVAGAAAALALAGLLGPGRAAATDTPGRLTLRPDHGSTGTAPFATFAAERACPTADRGTLAAVVRTPDGAVVSLAGYQTPTGAPPSGTLAGTIAGLGLPAGEHRIDLRCYADSAADYVVADSVTIHIDTAAGTWAVASTAPARAAGPAATGTSLSVRRTPARHATAVTLTATVHGAGAAGRVEFSNGARSLGTATVSDGRAGKTVQNLPAGSNRLTARFTPADATAYTASTSRPVTVTITPEAAQLSPHGRPAAGSGGRPEGVSRSGRSPRPAAADDAFTITVDPTDVTLTVNGAAATGSLSPITVNDQRSDSPGWTVSAQAGAFSGGGSQPIAATNLGWWPAIDGDAHGAVEGPQVEPGDTGLSVPATLGSAPAGQGQGSTTLGGRLQLTIPTGTEPGDYSSTLTVTTMTAAAS